MFSAALPPRRSSYIAWWSLCPPCSPGRVELWLPLLAVRKPVMVDNSSAEAAVPATPDGALDTAPPCTSEYRSCTVVVERDATAVAVAAAVAVAVADARLEVDKLVLWLCRCSTASISATNPLPPSCPPPSVLLCPPVDAAAV